MAEEITTDIGTRVLLENERVRIWEMTLAPGESSPLHRHLHDYLFVYATPGEMAVHDGETGEVTQQPSAAGFAYYREVGPTGLPPHRLENVGETTATHYLVELLGPSASEAPQPPQHNG